MSPTPPLPDPSLPPAKPPRGRPPRDRARVPGDSVFAPSMPTNGLDLMGMWKLPQAAWTEGRLKVGRKQYASSIQELVAESNIQDFDLRQVASEYGPGEYLLTLSAHPQQLWPAHNCKTTVAPEYARTQGWQAYQAPAPQPRLADVQALRTTAAALEADAPMTPANLMMLIEAVVERTVKAAAPPPPPPSPMGVDGMMQFWAAMSQMQSQTRQETLQLFKAAQGGDLGPAPENEGWGDAIAKALPALLEAFKPRPAPAMPPQPVETYQEPAEIEEEPMRVTVPLTQAELESFAGPVALLKPFAPQILMMIERSSDDAAVAANLKPYVPEVLIPDVLRLAKMVEAKGSAVLGIISPGLQTHRGAGVMAALAAQLSS